MLVCKFHRGFTIKKTFLCLFSTAACIYLILTLTSKPKDPLYQLIPPKTANFKIRAQDIRVANYSLNIMGREISCLETPAVYRSNRTRDILLLHGSSYNSLHWQNAGTLQLLASWGHRALAFDFPGYGRDTSNVLEPEDRTSFLLKLMSKAQMNRPVLVANSSSGFYVLPFIRLHQDRVSALIGLSLSLPVDHGIPEDFQNITTSGLIIYTKEDKLGERIAKILSSAPNFNVREVTDTEGKFYPTSDMFHRLLYNFLNILR